MATYPITIIGTKVGDKNQTPSLLGAGTLELTPGNSSGQGTYNMNITSGTLNGFSDKGNYNYQDCSDCSGQQVTIKNTDPTTDGVKMMQGDLNSITLPKPVNATINYCTGFIFLRFGGVTSYYEGIIGAIGTSASE